MDRIDFKTITAKAALEISNMPLEYRGGFLNRYVTRVDPSPETIRHMLIEKVWAKCIKQINAHNLETEPLTIEKALSILTKNNAVKEKIICKKDSFRIQLANCQYRAYRQGVTGLNWACPWPAGQRYTIQITGDQFAHFILQFDAEIPEILSRIPEIMDTIRERQREEQKELIEIELKEKVITSIIDQFLKPLGLSVKYTVGEGDMVKLDITQSLSAHLEIPLWQLQEKLKDADAVRAMLQVERPKEKVVKDDCFDFGINI